MSIDNLKGQIISKGNTADIYQWGEDKVIKIYHSDQPSYLCENEFKITEEISNEFGICPKPYELVYINGKIGAIYERINGITLLKELMTKVWTLKYNSKLFAHYHFSIHKPVDFKFPTVKSMLISDIRSVKELSSQEKIYLHYYIDQLPNDTVLCHQNFKPDSIIIRDNKAVVLDWGKAAIGDPLSDVAMTTIILKYGIIPSKLKLMKTLIDKIQTRFYKKYIKEYLNISNNKIEDVIKWELPAAASRLSKQILDEEKEALLKFVKSKIKLPMTEIRYARKEDIEILKLIHSESWEEAYKGIIPFEELNKITAEQKDRYFEKTISNGLEDIALIINGDDALGLISIGKCRDGDKDSSYGEIGGIYVRPKYWGRGIVHQLLNWGENELKNRGYKNVIVWANEENYKEKEFYEKMGYKDEGAAKKVYIGKDIDKFRYVKSLR